MNGHEGPCPPEQRDRLEARRELLVRIAAVLAQVGGLMIVWGLLYRWPLFSMPLSDPIVTVLGLAIFLSATAVFARSKGRSAGWAFLGLGCFFGWLLIAYLPRICRWCGRSCRDRSRVCPDCSAPL